MREFQLNGNIGKKTEQHMEADWWERRAAQPPTKVQWWEKPSVPPDMADVRRHQSCQMLLSVLEPFLEKYRPPVDRVVLNECTACMLQRRHTPADWVNHPKAGHGRSREHGSPQYTGA